MNQRIEGDEFSMDSILEGLNDQQRKAVTHDKSGRLQIIAGPGTGKTKVLISRVAYLLLEQKLNPERIIVTTFTKKAANEIVERLEPVLKGTAIDPSRLLLGTFHSICYRILRRYGTKLNLHKHTIADERDSMQILQEILQDMPSEDLDYLCGLPSEEFRAGKNKGEKFHGFDPKAFRRQISKLKASGIDATDYCRMINYNKALWLVYDKYQAKLKKELLLDFDDCLVKCYNLINQYPVLNFVEHVLVDEFQDTNEIQLRLMIEFASKQHNVTVVGDPDQSIYAFRNAKSTNFKTMKTYYQTKLDLPILVVRLVENYRSTSDILNVSESVMSQQSNRESKKLSSRFKSSFNTVHNTLSSTYEEARWIVYQIIYLTSLPNNVFKYLDISILVRASYQTVVIEKELNQMKIPYHMIRGKAFWERKEVMIILDYLRAISNPNDRIAYTRTLGFPKRGIGEKSLEQINKHLSSNVGEGQNVHEMLQDLPGVKLSPSILKVIKSHLLFLERMRDRANALDGFESDYQKKSLLEEFFNDVYVESGLAKAFEQKPEQEENIMLVCEQLLEFEPQPEELPVYVGGEESELATDDTNYIAKFVTSIGLYEQVDDKETQEDDKQGDSGKVSLSTIHGSKGLEWPIVFVPGLSEGSLPSLFVLANEEQGNGPNEHKHTTEDLDEERRCFYVAITRAKLLLNITSVVQQSPLLRWNSLTRISRFIDHLVDKFCQCHDCFSDWNKMQQLYTVRNISLPSEKGFDLKSYYQGYKKNYQGFVNLGGRRLDPLDYSVLQERLYDSSDHLLNLPTPMPIFSTAKSIDSASMKNRYDQIVEARKQLALKKSRMPKTIGMQKVNNQFKPHRPNPTVNENRAPPYTADRKFAPK